MTATCPTCGGESMLRGRCVLPWCLTWQEVPQEAAGGDLRAEQGLARVVGPSEGEA